MEHFAITLRNFFGTPISLNNKLLNDLIIDNKFDPELYKTIQQVEAIEILQEDAFQIQKMVMYICETPKIDFEMLTKVLPLMILKSINKMSQVTKKAISDSRDQLFHQSLLYINSHLHQNISMAEICSSLKSSERNLRYVFRYMTGLSPKRYIRALKLNLVRKELLKNDQQSQISFIASKWGFIHSGQFAADYRKLFGELPSETLKSRIA